MTRSRFAIIGGTLWGNRGAEAMVVTTIGRIGERVPGAEFDILSYYPDADRRLAAHRADVRVDDATPRKLLLVHFPFALLCWIVGLVGLRLPDAMLPAPVARLRGCRALFDVSGISFHDGRLSVVAYNVFCIWPALLLGVPVFHLSQARGPFENTLNRIPARWFLRACRHSFARGSRTAAYMKELGLPADRWSVAADVAFSFHDGDSITRENEAEVAALRDRLAQARERQARVVAISPSSVVSEKTGKTGKDYVSILAQTVASLAREGHHVLVLPNATRAASERARNNDLIVIRQLKAAVDGMLDGEARQRISWVLFDVNTDGIRALISACDILVTSRFHAMVAGLSLAVPTFVIGWSHKYGEVLELFGCEADAIDFSKIEDDLVPAIGEVLAGAEERRSRIAAALPAVRASSMRQFELAATELGLPAAPRP